MEALQAKTKRNGIDGKYNDKTEQKDTVVMINSERLSDINSQMKVLRNRTKKTQMQ